MEGDGAACQTPHHLRTAVLINLAAILERCDEQLLPAVYRFVGASWSASPTQLGYITLCRALVQALASPVGGIAGHFFHRGRVVGAGCLLWAACTAAFAGCRSLGAGIAVWGVNGVGLALVLPSSQSLIADLFAAATRGRASGLLYCTGALGGMLGALFATNMGSRRPLGVEGWRFAFLCMAAVSVAAGLANFLLTEDPLWDGAAEGQQQQQTPRGRHEAPTGGGKAAAEEADDVEGLVRGREPAEAAGSELPGPAAASGALLLGGQLDAAEADKEEGGDERQPLRGQGETAWRASPASSRHRSRGRRSHELLAGGGAAAGSGRRGGSPEGRPKLPLKQQAARLLREIGSVLCIPTFLLIVLQGIAGSVPWSALVFLTLYLQLCGMSDAQASFLVALFLAGTAVGGLIGGAVGDAAAKPWPNHGRLAATQFSVGIGIPFALLVFKGLPRDGRPSTVALYAAVLLSFALLKAWPAPCFNNPAFAEIVPPQQRNLVYAFDRCFEGAIAACAAPLVGTLSERMFGFKGAGAVTHDREHDLANAAALGNALLAFLVVPWCEFTLTLYSGLHWVYPKDKAAALQRQRTAIRDRPYARAAEEPRITTDRLSSSAGSAATDASVELSRAPSWPPAVAVSPQLPARFAVRATSPGSGAHGTLDRGGG